MDNAIKQEIMTILKTEGLDATEALAVQAVRAAFRIIALVVPKISTGLGMIIGPMLALVQPRVLALLDNIDAEDDPEY